MYTQGTLSLSAAIYYTSASKPYSTASFIPHAVSQLYTQSEAMTHLIGSLQDPVGMSQALKAPTHSCITAPLPRSFRKHFSQYLKNDASKLPIASSQHVCGRGHSICCSIPLNVQCGTLPCWRLYISLN